MPFDLNNRELAAATIVGAVAVYCLSSRKVRPSLFALVRSALQWRLLTTALMTWAVIFAGIGALKTVGLWSDTLLKDAITWAAFSSLAIAFRGISEADPNSKFKSLAMDQVKGIVAFEFLVNFYSMSYAMELVWLVLTAIVTLMIALGERDKRDHPALEVFKSAQGLLGLWMLAFVAYSIWQKPREIVNLEALRTFLLPIFLVIWVLPFGYLVSIVAGYESLFIRLKIGRKQPLDLRLYSQFKLIEFGGLNSSRLRRMGRLLGPRTSWPKDHDEVDQLFLALDKTMKDPVLDEPGDFVWPPPDVSWSSGPLLESISEYRQRIDPLIAKLLELENAAIRLIEMHPANEHSRSMVVAGFRAKFREMEDTVEAAISLPDLTPRIQKVDRRFQDYAASVDNLYRMTLRPDDKELEAWRATVELFAEWCRCARVKMELALERFGFLETENT